MKIIKRIIKFLLTTLIILLLVSSSVIQPLDPAGRGGVAANPFLFDYISWTVQAAWSKLSTASLGISRYLTYARRRAILRDYLDAYAETEDLRGQIEAIYADPNENDPQGTTGALQQTLKQAELNLNALNPLAELVVQDQISEIVDAAGLARYSQPFPPVLYQASDLPKNLILSPRDIIRQEASISLDADLDIQQITELERRVEAETGLSALVVTVGGVGTYPTMVIRTNRLPTLYETVAHEWTHNYLTLRPLGIRYDVSADLRTMNETTASIAGEEISRMLLETFFPRSPEMDESPSRNRLIGYSPPTGSNQPEPLAFDYRQEMYTTRLRAEELLSSGNIKGAEAYLEARRLVFWDNGYQIRRLNQAYFAFHGAYADQPYSAAGADPVGESVRSLWKRSRSLADFIRLMSGLKNYRELRLLVESF
jgi:hypothetical protein